MSTRPVTPDAPAASDRDVTSRFLPSDKNYRLTGELPADLEVAGTQRADDGEHIPAGIRAEREREQQTETPSEKDAASAAASDTAAASEAAETQRDKKGPAQSRSAQTSESRWQKRERELKEARAEIARLKTQGQGSQPQPGSETQQTSPPAAAAKTSGTPKPKIDDVDPKTNQPKYKTFAEYEEAKDDWLRKETLREFQESSAQTQREQQQVQAEAEIGRSLAKKFEGPRAKYADFDEVALGEHVLIPKGSVTDMFLIDSDHAGEVAYHLGQHPEITQAFYDFDKKTGRFSNKVTPQRQFRQLMEIEAKVAGSPRAAAGAETSSSARPITQAPRPPHQVSGKGTVAKDAAEDAVESGDFESYMRAENARVLAARKGK